MSDTSPPFDFSQYMPGFDFLRQLTAAGTQDAARPAPGLAGLPSWIAPTLDVDEIDKRLREFKAVQFWLEQNLAALKATVQALEVQKMTLSALQGMNLRMEDFAQAFTAAAPSAPPAGAEKARPAPAGAVDPLQWWNALTQQFQAIAGQTLQGAAERAAPASAAPGAGKPAAPKAKPAARKRAPRHPPPERP